MALEDPLDTSQPTKAVRIRALELAVEWSRDVPMKFPILAIAQQFETFINTGELPTIDKASEIKAITLHDDRIGF